LPEVSNTDGSAEPRACIDGSGGGNGVRPAAAAVGASGWEARFESLSALAASEGVIVEDLEPLGEAPGSRSRLTECISARDRSVVAYAAGADHQQRGNTVINAGRNHE
jgi:hypothetical protein